MLRVNCSKRGVEAAAMQGCCKDGDLAASACGYKCSHLADKGIFHPVWKVLQLLFLHGKQTGLSRFCQPSETSKIAERFQQWLCHGSHWQVKNRTLGRRDPANSQLPSPHKKEFCSNRAAPPRNTSQTSLPFSILPNNHLFPRNMKWSLSRTSINLWRERERERAKAEE